MGATMTVGAGREGASPQNPFVYLWVATGVLLNISGLASLASDLVKWASFFENIWDVYKVTVRDPVFSMLLVVWPEWFPRLPKSAADWLVIWSGLWLAISVYYYQTLGVFLLSHKFRTVGEDAAEKLFDFGFYWMLAEVLSWIVGAIVVVFMYLSLPISFVRKTFWKKISREELEDISRARSFAEKTSFDVDSILAALSRRGGVAADELEKLRPREPFRLSLSGEGYLTQMGKGLLDSNGLKRLRFELKNIKRDISMSVNRAAWLLVKNGEISIARQVLVYYVCILIVFCCVLFVNYTLLLEQV